MFAAWQGRQAGGGKKKGPPAENPVRNRCAVKIRLLALEAALRHLGPATLSSCSFAVVSAIRSLRGRGHQSWRRRMPDLLPAQTVLDPSQRST